MTIFSGCFFVTFGSKFHPSGVKLDPFRTTKSSTAVFQKKCKPFGFYPLKQGEMLDNFFLGDFLSFDSKFHLSGVKLDPFRTTKSSTAVSQKKCKPLGF